MELERPETIDEKLPLFDAIVGNFPYVSQDQVEKKESGYREVLRRQLVTDWFQEYPELFFYTNKGVQAAFEKMIAVGNVNGCDRAQAQHRISTYADLYVHLFFHTSRFLKRGGRMGIVTSNAWLDVNYGYELQEFFLRHFKVVAILESRREPWFVEASVNTVVTILELCDSAKERDLNLVRFVKVKSSLAELVPEDPKIEAGRRWQRLSGLTRRIEQAGLKYSKTHPLGVITEEDDNFRIRVLRQGEMLTALSKGGKTVKWGRYLRAPEIYFDLIHNAKLCLLSDVAQPKRGGLTRINEFFHVTQDVANRFGIETEYLLPLIKSPKATNTITIDPKDLKLRVFVCRRKIAELEKLRHRGALSYIRWGEKQRYKRGEFKGLEWPEGTWLKDRHPGWYALPEQETHTARVFWAKAYGDAHVHKYSPKAIVPDCRLYYLDPVDSMSPELLSAILNSSLTSLFLELTGRVILGDGVLDVMVEDARDYLLVPDIRSASKPMVKTIVSAFQPLLKRPIQSVFDEVKQADRHEMDSIVLTAIGLDPKKYLKPLYDAVAELVQERMELARRRSKERKTRARTSRAEKEVSESVLDEILPKGPKRFPEDFFSMDAARDKRMSVPLPESQLIFDSSPFTMGLYTKDRTFTRDAKSPAEAKFLIYAQQAGNKVAELPEKTVEVSRTVANYEKYLRELRAQLYETYYRRTLDHAAAARLTQSAFDRFRLPTVAN